jgi:4-aminobutyrate aminotransferase-like enzyme
MALKSLEILERPETLAMAAAASTALEAALGRLQSKAVVEIRGRGLMWGVELQNPAGPLLAELLAQGLLFLADGPEGNVLSFTPPFTISEEELEFGLEIIQNLLKSN